MIKTYISLILVLLLSACGAAYVFEGRRYENKDEMQRAADVSIAEMLAPITPMTKPVTSRKLIFAFPSERVVLEENLRRNVLLQGGPLNAVQRDSIEFLTSTNYRLSKTAFYAVQKKNIYPSVEFVGLDSLTGEYAASEGADVLYFVEPAQGAKQWFYVSSKWGREMFAFDQSAPTAVARTKNFLDALLAQAVRE